MLRWQASFLLVWSWKRIRNMKNLKMSYTNFENNRDYLEDEQIHIKNKSYEIERLFEKYVEKCYNQFKSLKIKEGEIYER